MKVARPVGLQRTHEMDADAGPLPSAGDMVVSDTYQREHPAEDYEVN